MIIIYDSTPQVKISKNCQHKIVKILFSIFLPFFQLLIILVYNIFAVYVLCCVLEVLH